MKVAGAPKKDKPRPDDKAQSERFRETARQVGADKDSDAAADDLMGRLAKQPPKRKDA